MTKMHLLEYLWTLTVAIAMLALIYGSRDLATRYNAWTSRVRSRSGVLPAPPSQKILERNTTVIAILIRIVATVLLLAAAWAAIFYK